MILVILPTQLCSYSESFLSLWEWSHPGWQHKRCHSRTYLKCKYRELFSFAGAVNRFQPYWTQWEFLDKCVSSTTMAIKTANEGISFGGKNTVHPSYRCSWDLKNQYQQYLAVQICPTSYYFSMKSHQIDHKACLLNVKLCSDFNKHWHVSSIAFPPMNSYAVVISF